MGLGARPHSASGPTLCRILTSSSITDWAPRLISTRAIVVTVTPLQAATSSRRSNWRDCILIPSCLRLAALGRRTTLALRQSTLAQLSRGQTITMS